MYNFGGIYLEMTIRIIIFGGAGLLFLFTSHFWVAERRNLKELFTGILAIFLCICTIGYYAYIIPSMTVRVYEGAFLREHRSRKSLIRKEYCFENENGLSPVFYLYNSTKEEIYPDEFRTDRKYRVYYEEREKIIVRIEEIG